MKVNGSCHCGQIRYIAEVDAERVSICHCTDCQTLSGSPYLVSVPTIAGTFRLLSGAPKNYIKVADSGSPRRHGFCSDCGTPVFSSADADNPSRYSLRVGCLEQKAQLPAKRRIWCKSALAWSQDISKIPAISAQ